MNSQSHVNNVTYVRYAESARIQWAYNYAVHIDPKNRHKWGELWTPRGDGLILRSMTTDYKFVRSFSIFVAPSLPNAFGRVLIHT